MSKKKSKRLTRTEWDEIRRHWEYDPDEPGNQLAAERAAAKCGFKVPAKSTLSERAKREGWTRRGSMVGVVQAAQRKADRMVNSDGSPVDTNSEPNSEPNPFDAKKAQAAREESEDKRAEILARHRQEWQQVAVLRQEALQRRTASVKDAFDRAKLAKITSEITMIQQTGERKAWGMDIVIDPEQLAKMSDAQLELVAAGKFPK